MYHDWGEATDVPVFFGRTEELATLEQWIIIDRCRLILDNVEAILQGGEHVGHYLEGYEEYGHLFRQVAEVPHQSCLLLTSREKPPELARLEGKLHSVRSLELGGLDYVNSKKIF